MFKDFIDHVRDLFKTNDPIPLHEPVFAGKELEYVTHALNSTLISSNVGEYVEEFENKVIDFTGSKFAISTVNGTSALHLSLLLNGVGQEDEVITQSLTFIATCNAIKYLGAEPIFIDVDRKTLSLSPEALENFIDANCFLDTDGVLINKLTEKKIKACLPMHTFGFPCQIKELQEICSKYNLSLVEDAAESLGSFYRNIHTGTFGNCSSLSFNGNKIITTGGGGMVLTNSEELASKARHLSTQAKTIKDWRFDHDQIGFNYRLPNLNAAIGVAQMKQLPKFLSAKRKLSEEYFKWGRENNYEFVQEPKDCKANYWLNALLTKNLTERDQFLETTNKNKIMTRPAWSPMHTLKMYENNQKDDLKNTNWLYERLVTVPSGVTVIE